MPKKTKAPIERVVKELEELDALRWEIECLSPQFEPESNGIRTVEKFHLTNSDRYMGISLLGGIGAARAKRIAHKLNEVIQSERLALEAELVSRMS